MFNRNLQLIDVLLIYTFTFCFIIFLITNYKKAVITLSVFAVSLLFVKINLFSLGLVYYVLGLVAIIIGLYRFGLKKFIGNPLTWCLFLPFLSKLATMFFANHYIPSTLLKTVVIYLMPVILYLSLNRKMDIKYYVKCMKWYLLITVPYCFYEELTSSNPIMAWCAQHPDLFGWMTNRIEGTNLRFGLRRCQSLFGGEAAFASVCIYFFFIIRKYQSNNYFEKKVFLLLTIAIPFCILFTGTRSAIIAFLIACIGLLSLKRVKKNWYYYAIALVVAFFMSSYLTTIYESIISSSTSDITGSNAEMRERQWEIGFYYLAQKPYFGNGMGFTSSLMANDEPGLLGAESMWLPLMMDQGIFGVISIIASYIIVIIVILRKKMYSVLWLILSFLTFKTVTSVVGVSENYVVLVAVFLMRYKELQKKSTTHLSLT